MLLVYTRRVPGNSGLYGFGDTDAGAPAPDHRFASGAPEFQGHGREPAPHFDDFGAVDLIRHPMAHNEHAAQQVMRELDELLSVFTRITGGIQRVGPYAIERLAGVLHDRIDPARQRAIGTGRYHDLDHRAKYWAEEEMLRIRKELRNRIRRLGGGLRQRARVRDRFPHRMLRRRSDQVALLG